MKDHQTATDREIGWEAAYVGDVPDTPVDRDVIRVASGLTTGTALDLGCGTGQNSIWLASRGWRVHCIDVAEGAIERAVAAAAQAEVDATFEKADVTAWHTKDRYDLVISTYALPTRGRGRTNALTVAREAVAPGGTLLVADFDVSLADSGWMALDDLVSLDEVTDALTGFELVEAEVRVTEHRHGSDANDLPVVLVVARHPGPLAKVV